MAFLRGRALRSRQKLAGEEKVSGTTQLCFLADSFSFLMPLLTLSRSFVSCKSEKSVLNDVTETTLVVGGKRQSA